MTTTPADDPTPRRVQLPVDPLDRPVRATYRLQLHGDFTFDHAAAQVPYLARLGVSHLYLSPILTAVPGSQHGYDVVSHRALNPELGGRERFEALATVAHEHGLGIVVDVVPNHMALVAPQWRNGPFWQVLRDGKYARTAHWFDIDWAFGPVGLPILGNCLDEVIAAGELALDIAGEDEGAAAGEPVVRYYDHTFPVALSTRDMALDAIESKRRLTGAEWADVLAAQHYRLGHWRDDAHLLNYRRFFEVDGLVGLRVEESDVFEQTHRELLDLHRRGLIDGFRIDHPDGLADPEGYLTTLTRACRPGTPIWVEKILHGAERLPLTFDCAGTTGYDAAAAILAAFAPGDGAASAALDDTWAEAEGPPSFAEVEQVAKTEAVDRLLGAEMDRLTRSAALALPGFDRADLAGALRALLVATQAYRIYVNPGAHGGRSNPPEQIAAMDALIGRAVRDEPDREVAIRTVGRALIEPESSVHDPAAARDLAVRFQQTSGPVMAKGIEDTAFYRWHRHIARNEVGADPAAHGGERGIESLVGWATNQAEHWPEGMTTLSTHDTKRSEDARARLLALAWHPHLWREINDLARGAARRAEVDLPTGHLVWQTIAAVQDLDSERLGEYLIKALREGKQRTTWIDVDEAYEARVLTMARELLNGEIGERITSIMAMDEVSEDVRVVTLAQKAVQLTLPGVPDVYQGNETLDESLVDPDNRRPVDYASRGELAARHREVTPPSAGVPGEGGVDLPADLSEAKFALTTAILMARREHPEAFGGGFTRLEVASGSPGDPDPSTGQDVEPAALAFARTDGPGSGEAHEGDSGGDTTRYRLVVLAARHAGGDDAAAASIEAPVLPGGAPWLDVVTGRIHPGGGQVEVSVANPAAVLIPAPSSQPAEQKETTP